MNEYLYIYEYLRLYCISKTRTSTVRGNNQWQELDSRRPVRRAHSQGLDRGGKRWLEREQGLDKHREQDMNEKGDQRSGEGAHWEANGGARICAGEAAVRLTGERLACKERRERGTHGRETSAQGAKRTRALPFHSVRHFF
jgi:hypothetical protein